jgi:DNA invertase Pin-like site-specific DNA recombinase
VVFKLTRFARDPPSPCGLRRASKYDHFAVRSLLQSPGISLRSATEPIDDTSTGKLMEGVLAASRSSTTTVAQNEPAPA